MECLLSIEGMWNVFFIVKSFVPGSVNNIRFIQDSWKIFYKGHLWTSFGGSSVYETPLDDFFGVVCLLCGAYLSVYGRSSILTGAVVGSLLLLSFYLRPT